MKFAEMIRTLPLDIVVALDRSQFAEAADMMHNWAESMSTPKGQHSRPARLS